MKNYLKIIAVSIFGIALFGANVYASSLGESLKGRILLQVESYGEAWYVNPDNSNRYYLGRPEDAFNLMRKLGLGISNNDLLAIPETGSNQKGNIDLVNRLAGKILLQVESNGEAWYVNPVDLKRYYLGRPDDAYNLMRELGLGITNSDLDSIVISEDGNNLVKTIESKKDEVETSIYHTVFIYGDEECKQLLTEALDLLYESKDWYKFFNDHIGILKCTPSQSGTYYWETPIRVDLGEATYVSEIYWRTSVLVHEACHGWQALREGGYYDTGEYFYGEEFEVECINVQSEYLDSIGQLDLYQEHFKSQLEERYWDVDFSERWW